MVSVIRSYVRDNGSKWSLKIQICPIFDNVFNPNGDVVDPVFQCKLATIEFAFKNKINIAAGNTTVQPIHVSAYWWHSLCRVSHSKCFYLIPLLKLSILFIYYD